MSEQEVKIMTPKKWYLCSEIGVNIYTGQNVEFHEEVQAKLKLLQSRISYKRDQGFKGTVYVTYYEYDETMGRGRCKKFRIYDVPFRGIGRITFKKWGEK